MREISETAYGFNCFLIGCNVLLFMYCKPLNAEDACFVMTRLVSGWTRNDVVLAHWHTRIYRSLNLPVVVVVVLRKAHLLKGPPLKKFSDFVPDFLTIRGTFLTCRKLDRAGNLGLTST
jgi:hypothetical protein